MPARLIERLGMALRIIKVDAQAEDHWDHAQQNRFWDLQAGYTLDIGDIVVFWRSGSPGKILGQARVAAEVLKLDPSEPHAWSLTDSRKGRYTHRVALTDFMALPPSLISYSDVGLRGLPHSCA